MYFNTRLFIKAHYLALFRTRFLLRRWLYVLFFTALFLAMWVVVTIGRLLDYIFFPEFRRQPVREPVFIIAPPRSGTTLLQKLMSLDEERFVHSKMYQIIFPSICYQKVIQSIARFDGEWGSPLAKLVDWLGACCFGGWDGLHQMRFDQPEEDEGFFVYTFVTEAILLLFPFTDELWEAGFADALPARHRRKLMDFYLGCLRRQLYANGPRKTILSKATQACGSIQCLLEAFPDARFITIVRHPYKCVASHVSIFFPVWQAHSPDIERNSQTSRSYARLAVEWYRHIHEMGATLDPNRFCPIDYRDLVNDPPGTVAKIYSHFGMEMSDCVRKRLIAAAQKERQFHSNHHYSLEEFGLSRDWIYQELRPLMETYALER